MFFSGLGGAADFFFYKSLSSCWSIFQWAHRGEPCSETGCTLMQKWLFISLIYFGVIMQLFFFCSLTKLFFLVWFFSSLAKQFALQIWTVDVFKSLLFLPSETHILYKYLISALQMTQAMKPWCWSGLFSLMRKTRTGNILKDIYLSLHLFILVLKTRWILKMSHLLVPPTYIKTVTVNKVKGI